MAKSESKSGWEAVKPSKTKPAKGAAEKDQKSKSPPKAKIFANTSPKENQKSKPDKKKAPSKPTKKPFEIKDGELDKMTGTGATGTLANLNCLNYLTAEFTAPERIPPYDKEAEDFPSSKLSPKHKERVEKILSSLQDPDSRTQFLKVLINNMISASRQAENTWGARAMGQLLMKMYPELSCVQSDVLGTETHPGAVLSIIWMFTRVKEFKSLMSVLFWLVLPRLKQKKIAEYLPKLLGDIELSIKNQGQVNFSKSHIAHLVFCLDDTKLTKPVMSVLGSFFNSIRPRLEPDHTWIESFIPLLTSATKRHSLPIILKAIEKDPAKAAQELKRLSEDNRLQVDLILDSCPETTLSQKYRDIITSKLNEPMAASDEIRKTKRNKKSTTSGPVQQTSGSGSGSKPAGFVSSLVKILVYSSILIGLSSQFEATRPIYKEYAHPYVATYVQPVVTEYIVPKYEEFVEPHVKTHLVPAYDQYLSPHVVKVKTLWTENGAPLLLQAISKTEKLYSTHLSGHVNKIGESVGPVWQQVRRDGAAMIKSVRESNKDLFSGWEKKSESILEDFRGYVAIAGIECRRLIDLGSQKGSEWFVLAKETCSDWLVKAQDMASNGSSDGMDKAKVLLSKAAVKAQNGIEIGLSEANKLMILTIQKTSVYYQQFLDATVDQRAMAIEKGQVGLDWLKVQSAEVIRLADEYEVSKYLEYGFEACGRSMIWLGDMMAEVAGMRTCCLKKKMTDTEDDDRFGNEPEVEEPKKKRRKKRKRGRIITVEDMPRKVREEFRTDQKAEKFLRLLGGQKGENVHASLTWMRRCKTGKFAEMMESELWDHFLSCFHRNYMFGRKGGFGFEKKLPSKDQLAWLEMKQWEQDSDEEELLELPDTWTEKDEEPEEYWVTTKKGEVEFQGKTYIKCSVMYGGGSQLDPRDSIADTTPLSIIEAQKEIEEADITPDEDEDQPKPLDMTQEEVEAKRQARREAMKKEIEEKQAEIERAKVAAETMFSGLGGGAIDGTEPQRRRQEIHWDYDKKAEPEFQGGKNGVNKFISDSYGYGGYRETEMARDQWKDLSYDKNHGQGASKYRKSAYDNWDQDFEQKYKWEDFASKWAIKRKEKNFYNKQHYKYEDITPARREFLEKQDENMTQKRQEADLSYWAQAAAQAAAAFLQEKDSGSSKLETAPWLKKPAPAPSNEDPRKKMSY